MSLTLRSRFSVLLLGVALTIGIGGPTPAAPAGDPDYEVVTAVTGAAPSATAVSTDPPGFNHSPLVVPAKATGPRLRFVLHDGTVLVGQVLAFDGQMYALRLPHSTLLVRKDFCASVGPVTTAATHKRAATRLLTTAHVVAGARS